LDPVLVAEATKDLLPAGLAALAVIGPAMAIGLLTGMSTSAMARNPEAAGAIRATFIIGAAFAEGLGILAFVIGVFIVLL
jgi:F-type H+-transporting ATPase subunit c